MASQGTPSAFSPSDLEHLLQPLDLLLGLLAVVANAS